MYAVNGAGIKSESVKSNELIIDTTPPNMQCKIQYGTNLLTNPDFQEDLSVGCTFHPTGKVPQQSQKNTISLSFGESIQQTVQTSHHRKYQITILAQPRHQNTTKNSSLIGEGINFVKEAHLEVSLPNHNQIILLQNFHRQNEWEVFHLYFIAHASDSEIRLTSLSRYGQVEIDKIEIMEMVCEEKTPDPVHVHLKHYPSGKSSISSTWMATDMESPVVHNLWAIGYTPGECLSHK